MHSIINWTNGIYKDTKGISRVNQNFPLPSKEISPETFSAILIKESLRAIEFGQFFMGNPEIFVTAKFFHFTDFSIAITQDGYITKHWYVGCNHIWREQPSERMFKHDYICSECGEKKTEWSD